MARFLFWNINKKPLVEQIAALCHENDVDVLILAESEIRNSSLMNGLNKGQTRLYKLAIDFKPKPIVTILIRYPSRCMTILLSESRFSIYKFKPLLGLEMLVVGIHLPSKIYKEPEDQAHYSRYVIRYIRRLEKDMENDRTLVVGDFNMNPFENGMVSADGFQAVMDKHIASKGGRTVQEEYWSFFYNPMWSRIGDRSQGPPGTHFYDASGHSINYFWNTIDQVLLSPSLADYLSEDDPKVLTSTRNFNLLTSEGVPDKALFSDHLPILFNLEIEKGGLV